MATIIDDDELATLCDAWELVVLVIVQLTSIAAKASISGLPIHTEMSVIDALTDQLAPLKHRVEAILDRV